MKKIRETGHLLTEKVNTNSVNIDKLRSDQIVDLIIEEDKQVSDAIAIQKENISKAIDLVVSSLKKGGRIFFVGAGTSGRLGVLEAAECPPTFGTEPEMIQAVIAGGKEAVWSSVEGAEDSEEDSVKELRKVNLNDKDIVIGIAASTSTPFVVSALRHSKAVKGSSVLITCNKTNELLADILIELLVGPEVIVGSTRLKAGTATKQVLNMITTAAMVRIGKTYKNLMVDVQPKSSKLKDRAIRIVMEICEVEKEAAHKLLVTSNWKVKESIVMYKNDLSFNDATKLLDSNNGFLREVVD